MQSADRYSVMKAAEKCVVYQLVWHSLPHVRCSTCLSYVRVLCSCSGKRRFWPRWRCTGGFVVRVPALRERRINSLLRGFRCVGILAW